MVCTSYVPMILYQSDIDCVPLTLHQLCTSDSASFISCVQVTLCQYTRTGRLTIILYQYGYWLCTGGHVPVLVYQLCASGPVPVPVSVVYRSPNAITCDPVPVTYVLVFA